MKSEETGNLFKNNARRVTIARLPDPLRMISNYY
jgi:hypothetical protein